MQVSTDTHDRSAGAITVITGDRKKKILVISQYYSMVKLMC